MPNAGLAHSPDSSVKACENTLVPEESSAPPQATVCNGVMYRPPSPSTGRSRRTPRGPIAAGPGGCSGLPTRQGTGSCLLSCGPFRVDSLGSAKTFNTKRAVERHSKSLSARLVAPNPSVRADPDTVGGLQVAYKPRVTKTSRGASPITRFLDHEKDGVPNQRLARGVCLSPLNNKGWGWP